MSPYKRKLHLNRLHTLVDKALADGAERLAIGRVRWNIAGTCSSPFITELYARPSGDELLRKINNKRRMIVVTRTSSVPLTLELHTPCRKCEKCKLHRQRLWAARARDECTYAARTWFGTLTLRPEAWLEAVNQCRLKEIRQGVDFDSLPRNERLALIHARTGKEVTKMLKRIRKCCPAHTLRHLVVLELTKAEVIHYHLLIHEVSDLYPVRHAQLAQQWALGFSKWKLVKSPAQGAYVAKYLSKSLLARVRASKDYGQGLTLTQSVTTVSNGRSTF